MRALLWCLQETPHNNSGIFQPVIAYDGTICGNWAPYKEECQMDFFNDDYTSEGTKAAWIRFMNYKQS